MVALLTSKGESAILRRWNIVTGAEMSSFQMGMNKVSLAVFAKNNKMLVTGYRQEICVWNAEGDCWTRLTTINHPSHVCDVTRSGDVIAPAWGDSICFWRAHSGEKMGEYRGHTSPIESLHFSPQEDRLVSASHDGTLRNKTRSIVTFSWSHSSSRLRHVLSGWQTHRRGCR